MLIECPNDDCSIQFSVNAQTCPSCGAENQRTGEEAKDVEFEKANSRHKIAVCAIAGVFACGYFLSLTGNLAGRNWIALPISAVLFFVFWKIFMTAARDEAPKKPE